MGIYSTLLNWASAYVQNALLRSFVNIMYKCSLAGVWKGVIEMDNFKPFIFKISFFIIYDNIV